MLKRRLKEPFGKAGLTVAILALVLAMVGGAWAAAGLNSKQKKEVTKIAKKYAGKPGATGPAGAAGTNGTNGTNGTGTPGAPGTNGKTVLHGTTTPAVGTGTEGDFYIKTGLEPEIFGPKTTVWGSGTKLKGEPGEPGVLQPGETLCSECTETGTFVTTSTEGGPEAAISFPIPLAGTGIAEGKAHFVSVAEQAGTHPSDCGGEAEQPEAAKGSLCIYEGKLSSPVGGAAGAFILKIGASGLAGGGAGPAGAVMVALAEPTDVVLGSWAVTAP